MQTYNDCLKNDDLWKLEVQTSSNTWLLQENPLFPSLQCCLQQVNCCLYRHCWRLIQVYLHTTLQTNAKTLCLCWDISQLCAPDSRALILSQCIQPSQNIWPLSKAELTYFVITQLFRGNRLIFSIHLPTTDKFDISGASQCPILSEQPHCKFNLFCTLSVRSRMEERYPTYFTSSRP